MAAEQQFERYSPVNPLPAEIAALARDETVCKFCGVSYLIHNEMKKLEGELERVREQLRDYESMKERVGGLEDERKRLGAELHRLEVELRTAKTGSQELQRNLAGHEERITSLSQECRDLNEKCQAQARGLVEQEARLAQLQRASATLPKVREHVQLLQAEREAVRGEVVQLQAGYKAQSGELSAIIALLCDRALAAESRERERAREAKCLNTTLSELSMERATLTDTVARLTDKLSALEGSERALSHAQQQNVQLSQHVSGMQRELEEVRADLAGVEGERGKERQILAAKAQENTSLKERMNELTRRHTAQLGELNGRYEESLAVQGRLRAKLEAQVRVEAERGAGERAGLAREAEQLKTQLGEATKERDAAVERARALGETHRMQLSDLHRSYQEQLEAALAERSSLKVEMEGRLAARVEEGVDAALARATEEHEVALAALEERYRTAQRELEAQIDKLSEQFSRDLGSKEAAVREIERVYEERCGEERRERDGLERTLRERDTEIAGYKTQLEELERRPAVAAEAGEGLKKRNAELEGEVLKLQRIVNKECEERMELTEKLKQLQVRPPDSGAKENGNNHNKSPVSRKSDVSRRSDGSSKQPTGGGRPTRPRGAQRFSSWTQK